MDQNLDNKKEFKEKLILFFKENKLKLLAFSAILILVLFIFLFLQLKEKKKII